LYVNAFKTLVILYNVILWPTGLKVSKGWKKKTFVFCVSRACITRISDECASPSAPFGEYLCHGTQSVRGEKMPRGYVRVHVRELVNQRLFKAFGYWLSYAGAVQKSATSRSAVLTAWRDILLIVGISIAQYFSFFIENCMNIHCDLIGDLSKYFLYFRN